MLGLIFVSIKVQVYTERWKLALEIEIEVFFDCIFCVCVCVCSLSVGITTNSPPAAYLPRPDLHHCRHESHSTPRHRYSTTD